MAIYDGRYFLLDDGAAAVSTTVTDEAGGQFSAKVEMPTNVTFNGDANAVMDSLSALSNHFSAAREALLLHITEG